MEAIKEFFRNHPEKKSVFFNTKGEHQFRRDATFTEEKTREEILEQEEKVEEVTLKVIEPATVTEKKVKTKKNKS